jgi:putative endopeptidase
MTNKSNPFFIVVVAVMFALACNTPVTTDVPQRKTLSFQNIDSSVKPGNDFFQFANGKWYDTATILPTESRAGARIEMDFITRAHIKSILEETSSSKNAAGSIEQQVGDFYTSGMDTTTIEKLGFDPVQPYLKQIDGVKDIKDMLRFVAEQYAYGNPSLVGQGIGADEKNSNKNIAIYYQTGLGLPDRDYYFKTDAATGSVVSAYKKYMFKLFKLVGDDSATAEKNVSTVYNLEKIIAASHRTNVELRDPQTNYNKFAVADLDKKMPVLAWKQLLQNLHVQTDSIDVGQPGYYAKLNELLKTIPLESWKLYLRFHTLDNASSALSKDFANANFEYYGTALSGQKIIKERWQRIYGTIDNNIGEALGQLYVKKYFSEGAKKRITELVNNLQKAFEARIDKLDWMSDSTKQKAKEKLAKFTKKVGYPDKWRDYSKVAINKNAYFENLISCNKNEYSFQVNKVDKPVDRTEWGMTPPTNNAYNNPTFNEIVFPAGILQFPMFDEQSDDAMNYGGIGMVIGHEMTHGFDDQGAQYDKDGNLKNWWSKDDYAKFKAKEQAVINLYNSFVVLDSVHINGALTQGENTADMGGIAIAYDAFKLTKEGNDTTKIDGLTPDQRFFLSFAQCWRKKVTDESLRQQVNTDPHSPAKYRVWGPLMNFDPFYKAFNVQPGDKMYKADSARIKIW